LLESLVVFARLGDRVTVASAGADEFSVEGPFADGVPLDPSNLVLRARDALRIRMDHAPSGASSSHLWEAVSRGESHRPPPLPRFDHPAAQADLVEPPPRGEGNLNVSIRLTKNLPIASGVGGGSSDAAAALKALDRLWKLGRDHSELAGIGVPLGADLPMCLAARPLIARGIGEAMELLSGFPTLHLVLVNPGVALSTPMVFKELSRPDNPPLPRLPTPLDLAALLAWLSATRNDLEAPAHFLAPQIGEALAALSAQSAAFVRMSGSGASCFGLFENASQAKLAADTIRAARPSWFVVATRTNH
jgi:4-diphosphocytidyl-2-C-methyl-D-erythritol kinase